MKQDDLIRLKLMSLDDQKEFIWDLIDKDLLTDKDISNEFIGSILDKVLEDLEGKDLGITSSYNSWKFDIVDTILTSGNKIMVNGTNIPYIVYFFTNKIRIVIPYLDDISYDFDRRGKEDFSIELFNVWLKNVVERNILNTDKFMKHLICYFRRTKINKIRGESTIKG